MLNKTKSGNKQVSVRRTAEFTLPQTLRKIKHLNSLVEASKILNTTLDLDRLLEIIMRIAQKNTGAKAGTIYLLDEDSQTIWSKVSDAKRIVELRLKIGEGVAGYVAKTGEIINTEDAYNNPNFSSTYDHDSGFRTRNMLCMPMRDEEGHIIGVFQLLNKKSGLFLKEDEEFLAGLSTHAALAIRQAELHKKALENKAIQCEISIAREIQNKLLPDKLPNLPTFEFAATNQPSEVVSGDYYDFYQVRTDKLGIAVGDVAGKGVPAALLMASLRTALYTPLITEVAMDPAMFIGRINQYIYDSSPQSKFITLFYAELDAENNRMQYVNAGHNPPLLVRKNGKVETLTAHGLSLGLQRQTSYKCDAVEFENGDVLILYTDGITEAMDLNYREYGEERLYEIVSSLKELSAQQIVDEIIADVQAHRGKAVQNDDITLAVIKKNDS